MSTAGMESARAHLQELAERGIFRAYSESTDRAGRLVFRFIWLVDAKFTLVIDPGHSTLQFKDLLPAFSARSEDYRELRSFVQGKMDPGLRPHRRVDSDRAEVSCSVRSEVASITLTLKDDDYAYGVERLLNLVNELFGQLQMYRPEYMIEEFGLSEE